MKQHDKKHTIKSYLNIFLLATLLFTFNFIKPSQAYAQLGEGDCGAEEINTAIGCVPVGSSQGFVGFILPWGIGIAGGIALILIVVASIIIMTSAGDPKKAQAGKELLTSAVGGLILLVFGIFILEFVGVDILNIPEFGR